MVFPVGLVKGQPDFHLYRLLPPPVYKDDHYAGLSAIIIRPAIIVRGPSYHNTSCYHCAGLCICFAGLSAIIIREFCICFMDLLLLCSVSAIIMQCFCYYYAVFLLLLCGVSVSIILYSAQRHARSKDIRSRFRLFPREYSPKSMVVSARMLLRQRSSPLKIVASALRWISRMRSMDSFGTTRWHGISTDIGFRPIACATARTPALLSHSSAKSL